MNQPGTVHIRKNIGSSSIMVLLLLSHLAQADGVADDYIDMSLEDLLSIEVTSVSKKKQRLNEVAAAVFVITQEDIRRSGVTSIPEALRMAPGIQVARMDANKWAISSRGFASQFSNKLLVMIDGRTVYTPAYSGVYWDVQDTLLDDIERIEVIRGPGATIWGANAVNGVINIITQQASETQGGLLVAGAGDEEKAFVNLRYGTEMGHDTFARFYLKYNDRDSSYAPDLKDDASDDWQSLRGGFRIDGQITQIDHWTVQGDVYDQDVNQIVSLWQDPADPANAVYAPFFLSNLPDTIESSGWNLLGKWEHQLSEQASTTVQFYYDHTERSESFSVQTHDILDIDFQQQLNIFQIHELIWGLGYRHIKDDFDNTFNVAFRPESNNINLYSAFVQDEIELLPQTLSLILGSKYEHNEYTGNEIQPSARLVWLVNEHSTLWGSLSRAIRTPSRVEDSGEIVTVIVPLPPTFTPVISRLFGNEDFNSEELLAYEVGYRLQPRENLSFDLALFYNEYDHLQTFETTNQSGFVSDFLFDNKLSAYSYGMELTVDWRVLEWWQLKSNYSFIEFSASLDGGSSALSVSERLIEGSSPSHQFSLRSMMDLSNSLTLDLWVYYVERLKQTNNIPQASPISAYTSLNVRFAWRPRKNLELSLVGQNLLDSTHPEFVAERIVLETEVERSLYGQIRWEF